MVTYATKLKHLPDDVSFNQALKGTVIMWICFSSVITFLSVYSLHLARHGPSFIKKFLLLFLASFVAFIVMCVCLLIPPLGAFAHFLTTLVTSFVFSLKLAVFWVFAFLYWVTASNFDEIIEQESSEIKARSNLAS